MRDLVFSTERDDEPWVCEVKEDDGAPDAGIDAGPEEDTHRARPVAFAHAPRFCERGSSLEAYRVQNGSLRHVALGAGVSEARFSPDGRWLMYRREPGILWFRSVGDRFGEPLGLRMECDGIHLEDDSDWSPEGNAFVCLRRTYATDTLAVVSLDGDVPRSKKLITQKIRGELTASWSGANHVVATSSSNYTSELRLFQRAGEGWTERDLPATDDAWHVSDLHLRESVSPDGRWLIAYGRVPSDSGVPTDVLMAFALDGTRRRFELPLFVGGAQYAPLAWRSTDDAMLLTRTIEWSASVAAWEPERGRIVEIISRPPEFAPDRRRRRRALHAVASRTDLGTRGPHRRRPTPRMGIPSARRRRLDHRVTPTSEAARARAPSGRNARRGHRRPAHRYEA